MEEILDQTDEIKELIIEPKVRHSYRITLLFLFAFVFILIPIILMVTDVILDNELAMALTLFSSPIFTLILTLLISFPSIKRSPNQFKEFILLLYSSIPFLLYLTLMGLILLIIISDGSIGGDDPYFIIAFMLIGSIVSTITYAFLKSKKLAATQRKWGKTVFFSIILIVIQIICIGFLLNETI